MSQNQTSNVDTTKVEEEVPLNMFSHDEKISYADYEREIRPPIVDLLLNQNNQNEDCEREEDESEFMADMPTNESYTISDDGEQKASDNAIKFLTETGMLTKVENKDYFDLNIRSDDSVLGEIDTLSRSSQNKKEKSLDNFKFFEDPFEDDEFNPAETLEKQLERDPIPEPIAVEIWRSDVYSDIYNDQCPDIELFTKPSEELNKFQIVEVNIWDVLKATINTSKSMDEEEPTNAKSAKKKLTEFGYLLQRKGFRLMRKYYKEKFEQFGQNYDYKKKVKSITPAEINQLIALFMQVEFATILSQFSESERIDLLESLKSIVLSDRANKREPMINGTDLKVVRNLFGKYTQKTMKIFLANSSNSFLYTHFYLINGRSACFQQSDVDQANFNVQMKKLMLESFRSIFPCVKPLYEKLYESHGAKL